MKNKKNKYGFIVLVEVLVVLLFILKLHNNLDECRAIDDAPYYWLIFDYTGKPNLPEMIIVTKPGILGTKKLFAETDYEFADNASEEKSKTGGTIELKGKGKYRGTIKVKIYVYDNEIKTTDMPSITISKNDFKDGKCIKQLYTPKVLGMLDESLPTLKCKFRLSKENSKTISIDPATGTIASNSTEEKISVSSDGKVTIKSTEKETYMVECVISADHTQGQYKATGQADSRVENALSKFAIQGVQFTYLKVGNIEQYSNTKADGSDIKVVYEIPTALAEILNLSEGDATVMTGDGIANPCTNAGVLHYTSTQIDDALNAILTADDVAAKNALESYLIDYKEQNKDSDDVQTADTGVIETDANGLASKDGLPLGLYLMVETKVPEQVTSTVNPWFLTLPCDCTVHKKESHRWKRKLFS